MTVAEPDLWITGEERGLEPFIRDAATCLRAGLEGRTMAANKGQSHAWGQSARACHRSSSSRRSSS